MTLAVLEQVQALCRQVQLFKLGPPGDPPRPGLVWHEETHRWRRPAYEQVGGQKGSQPGGLFKDEDGNLAYIKTTGGIRARMEVLSARLYELAGVKVPDLSLTVHDGKTAVKSPWIDSAGPMTTSQMATSPEVAAGFVADAWLANWDVVGLTGDNIVMTDKGAVRIDVGGALIFRAQGKFKPLPDKVTELDTLRDPKINPSASKVFGIFPDSVIRAGAKQLGSITNEQIDKAVDESHIADGPLEGFPYDQFNLKLYLKNQLKRRRDYIVQTYGSAPAVPQAKPQPPQVVQTATQAVPPVGQPTKFIPGMKIKVKDTAKSPHAKGKEAVIISVPTGHSAIIMVDGQKKHLSFSNLVSLEGLELTSTSAATVDAYSIRYPETSPFSDLIDAEGNIPSGAYYEYRRKSERSVDAENAPSFVDNRGKRGLSTYLKEGYDGINESMRNQAISGAPPPPKVANAIKSMTNLMRPMQEPQRLFRGVKNITRWGNSDVGSIVSLDNFWSTSRSVGVARAFAGGTPTRAVVEFETSPNTWAITLSNRYTTHAEHETIIGAGQQFEVVHKQDVVMDGAPITYIKVRAIR